MLNTTIRFATAEDCDTLTRMRIEFITEKRQLDPTTRQQLENAVRAYFGETLTRGDYIGILAEADGQTVAAAGMVIWRIAPNAHIPDGRKAYIQSVYTKPDYRRRGICTQIIRRLVNRAGEMGIEVVHLHAEPDGIAIYRREGFTEPGDPELVLHGK